MCNSEVQNIEKEAKMYTRIFIIFSEKAPEKPHSSVSTYKKNPHFKIPHSLHCMMFSELTGRSLNVYSWKERKLTQVIPLGEEGVAPLEIRFLHDPLATEGFVGCAVTSSVFRCVQMVNIFARL